MPTVRALLAQILEDPTPDTLWQLHPHLLARPAAETQAARDITRAFYSYLSQVRSKLTSKQYSSLAALLAAGAVSVIAMQEAYEALVVEHRHNLSSLFGGALASMLEAFSTVQHVKAWETEFASEHEEAVWSIYVALWHISADAQPDLPVERRHELIDSLLAPVRQTQTDSMLRLVLVIRLYQLLLAILLAPLLEPQDAVVDGLAGGE